MEASCRPFPRERVPSGCLVHVAFQGPIDGHLETPRSVVVQVVSGGEGRHPLRMTPFVTEIYSEAGAFLYQPVITPTRWTIFCVRMIGALAFGSKSTFASVVRQMLVSATGAAM